MKTTKIFILLLCLGMSTWYCTSTRTAASPEKTKTDEPAFRELADLLRKEPGLDVKGSAPNYRINIRGKQAFLTSSEPLFVIDGIAVGNSYAQAANMINITDIQDIKVLKGSEATSWGSRGANGVIEIRMKRGQPN